MKCNNCQFENAPGATACAQCGSPLPVPQQGGYTQQATPHHHSTDIAACQ